MKMTKVSLALMTATALYGSLVALPTPAQATAVVLPEAAQSTANPSRIQGQLHNGEFAPSVSPRVEVKDIIKQKAPEGAEKMTFALKDIELEGVTVYDPAALKALAGGKVGSTVSLADMYVLANDMTTKYRNDGYILTQVIIPPQTIEGGHVKFQVVEGYVGNVTVTGDEQFGALGQIRAYAEKLKTGKALNAGDLERYLLLINDLPGVQARSILSPSQNEIGAADLQIIVQRDLYEGYLGVDNFGSRYLGPLQATAVGTLNSYLQQNERISLQAVYAPSPDIHPELAYGSVVYNQPITEEGTTIEFIGSYTATNPGYTLEDFDVAGRSKFLSVSVEHPFIRSRSANLYGHIGFDVRGVTTTNNIEPPRKDDIRALRIGGRAEMLDTFLGAGVNSVNVEIGKGLEVLGASSENSPNLSRIDGQPDFTKFEAELQRLQRITDKINLLVAARGQYSADHLLASEQFGVGGPSYGRGYDSSEVVGDKGFAGKLEVQWKEPFQTDFFQTYQLYGFVDGGRTFNENSQTDALRTNNLVSTGAGLRADFLEDTKMGLYFAVPVNRDVETYQSQSPRVYFSLNRSF